MLTNLAVGLEDAAEWERVAPISGASGMGGHDSSYCDQGLIRKGR